MNAQRWFNWIVLVICIDHSYCLQQQPLPKKWVACSLSGMNNCSYSRFRPCLATGSFGILCTNQENIYEQIAHTGCGSNCLNSSYWKNETITQTCHGDCYDATRIYQYDCDAMDSNNCKITSKVRCYNNQSCSGIWTPQSALNSCSKSCGSGFQLSTAVCRNSSEIPYELSHNCPGTGGIINQKTTINATCNTHPCPAWSAWSESKPCSKTCNNGTRFLSSTCMYMNAFSLLCNGSRNASTRSKEEFCNTGSCDAQRYFTEEWYFPIIVVAGIVILVILIALVVCCMRRNSDKSTNSNKQSSEQQGRESADFQLTRQQSSVNASNAEVEVALYIDSSAQTSEKAMKVETEVQHSTPDKKKKLANKEKACISEEDIVETVYADIDEKSPKQEKKKKKKEEIDIQESEYAEIDEDSANRKKMYQNMNEYSTLPNEVEASNPNAKDPVQLSGIQRNSVAYTSMNNIISPSYTSLPRNQFSMHQSTIRHVAPASSSESDECDNFASNIRDCKPNTTDSLESQRERGGTTSSDSSGVLTYSTINAISKTTAQYNVKKNKSKKSNSKRNVFNKSTTSGSSTSHSLRSRSSSRKTEHTPIKEEGIDQEIPAANEEYETMQADILIESPYENNPEGEHHEHEGQMDKESLDESTKSDLDISSPMPTSEQPTQHVNVSMTQEAEYAEI